VRSAAGDRARSRGRLGVDGVAAILALEGGSITTEVGRQPGIVYNALRTVDAVSPAPGLHLGVYAVVAIYIVLTGFTVYVLRRLARKHDTPAPQEVHEPPARCGRPTTSG
jgi:cytochrome d ubiquinol oxidase subunit I